MEPLGFLYVWCITENNSVAACHTEVFSIYTCAGVVHRYGVGLFLFVLLAISTTLENKRAIFNCMSGICKSFVHTSPIRSLSFSFFVLFFL